MENEVILFVVSLIRKHCWHRHIGKKVDYPVKLDGFAKSPTSIRQAVRQAHGPEQDRRTHGPEQNRRTALRCILRHCSVF